MKIRLIRQLIESSKEGFAKIVSLSSCFVEISRLYGLPEKGKSNEFLSSFCKKWDVSIKHFDRGASSRTKYKMEEKICPFCKKVFLEKIGKSKERIWCSRRCANRALVKEQHSPEMRRKVSEAMKIINLSKRLPNYKCEECQREFKPRNRPQRFCSKYCAIQNNRKNPEIIRKHRLAAAKRYAAGTQKLWPSRKGCKPSFPEIFFTKVLKNNNIDFERERKFGKYFIDFALPNKVALEIDGRQHDWIERAESDKKKDSFLKQNGWKVYRIKWNSINSESGKELMKEKISDFLKFYHSA